MILQTSPGHVWADKPQYGFAISQEDMGRRFWLRAIRNYSGVSLKIRAGGRTWEQRNQPEETALYPIVQAMFAGMPVEMAIDLLMDQFDSEALRQAGLALAEEVAS